MNKRSRKNKDKVKNKISFYRRRMRLSQRRVASLLDHQDATTLSTYESGVWMPTLVMGFRLAIILRIPVEFLYPELYNTLREQIHKEEEQRSLARRKDRSHHSRTHA